MSRLSEEAKYVYYCQHVLGISEILSPPGRRSHSKKEVYVEKVSSAGKVVPDPAKRPKLIFLTESEDSAFEEEEQKLLEKMAASIQLMPEQYRQLSLPLKEIFFQSDFLESVSAIMVFSEKLFRFLSSNFPKMPIYFSPAPKTMIQTPQLKRQAWECLKQIKASLDRSEVT